MADDKFKLPGSSYEVLADIIKSYGQFNVPVGLEEVSKLIGKTKEDISRNAGFLIEINVLEAGKKKALTSLGKELAQALEHEMDDKIRLGWQQIVNQNDFASKLISAIKIRNGMDEGTLQSHIAYSAGQPKKPQIMTGAKALIDILKASEMIKEHDGKYVVSKIEENHDEAPNVDDISSAKASSLVAPQATKPAAVSSFVAQNSGVEVKISINVSVECSIGELDELGDRIKEIIKQVNSVDAEPEETENEE